MRVVHLLAEILLLVTLLAVSLLLLFSGFLEQWGLRAIADALRDERQVLIGWALLLLLLLYGLTGVLYRRRERFFSFDTQGGAVSISLSAMQDFLRRIGEEFAALRSLQPRLRAHRGALDIELDVSVRGGALIPELCRVLQDRVREKVHDNLGLADVRSVRVNVIEIVPAENGARPGEGSDWEGAPKS